MPILGSTYAPILPFRNGHINTMYSALYRTVEPVVFSRQRIETADDDFLDVDFLNLGNRKVVVLCHGLEGNSSATYIQGMSRLLGSKGYDIAALNYRFCSGEINRQLRTYHSGETEDLNTVVQTVLPYYDDIYLIGFSLGGNIVLKYMGDGVYPLHPKIKASAGISVLVDLHGAALELSKLKNRYYTKRFLKTLAKKITMKHEQFPDRFDIQQLENVKRLIDFDECFTSQLNGFKDAKDYYDKSNSKQFLTQIDRPTLVINALDDPFLSTSCYPYEEAHNNAFLHLMTPRFGGHVGFMTHNSTYLFHELEVLKFFEKN